MNLFGHDWAFWAAAIVAACMKLILSPWEGVLRGLATFAAALFFAVVFTDPMLSYLNLDPNTYRTAMTAIVALTGEGIARWLLYIVAKPSRILDFIKLWKGGK